MFSGLSSDKEHKKHSGEDKPQSVAAGDLVASADDNKKHNTGE